MAHAVILAFPLFAGLWVMGRKRWATILVLLLLFPASLTESHTAKLALLAGALCGTAAFYRPLWVQRVMAIMSVVILGWPFYAQVLFTRAHEQIENWHSSWRHRMEIWDYLSYRIGERPFLGWGLGTTHMLDFSQPHGDWYQALKLYGAPHPHNFITELWVETGIIGLMLGWVFLLLTLCAAARMPRALQPFALGGWAASVVIAMFGFDFWTDSLWGAFALAACAFGMLQKRIEGSDHIAHI
jgi:O-antigen ligase